MGADTGNDEVARKFWSITPKKLVRMSVIFISTMYTEFFVWL